MLQYLKNEANLTHTENGAVTYQSTQSECLDLFATIGALRRESDEEITNRFLRAYAENADLAMKTLFFARDIRGGIGERRVFRTILRWLAHNEPQSVEKNIPYIAEYGRYDDLLALMGTKCERDALAYIKKQLEADCKALEAGESASLLAKWLPSANASNDDVIRQAKHIARSLGMNDAQYRKTLNVIPAINTVDGFNPADFVRTTVGEEGENDLYLDVKYRLLWFRLHHPNGKIDPELIRVDEKNAIVCCRIYADKADPADQFIGKAYSQRFSTEDRFGDRFLEIAETVAKGRALADAGYGTQFCMNGEALASIIADAPIKMPPDEDAGHPGSVVASFTAQPTADPPVFSQTATAPKSTQPAQQQVQPPVQQSHAPAPEPPKTLDEYLRVMTIEQAKAVKVDFGRFSGWSLGEIAMKSPGDLAWYVKNYSGHNLALKAGATKLLETVGQMAS